VASVGALFPLAASAPLLPLVVSSGGLRCSAFLAPKVRMFEVHHFPTVGEPIKLENSVPFAAGRKSTECRRRLRVAVDDPMPFFAARPGFAVHPISRYLQ